MKNIARPGPKQTEDSVVWFALLARARLTGETELLQQAIAKLAELGINIRLINGSREGGAVCPR